MHEQEIYIYVLMEFQSSVDHMMALRVLNYVTNFYMDFVVEHGKGVKLPAVFPMVLYNGDEHWTAAIDIAALIEATPRLGRYELHYRYFKIAENEYSIEQLLSIQNIVSTLFLAETYFDRAALMQRLLDLFEDEEDKYAISLFINWCRQLKLRERMDDADFGALETVYRSREEVGQVINAAMRREEERWVQKHLAELLPQVEAQMEAKARVAVLVEQLTHRFGVLDSQLRDKLRQLNIEQLEKMSAIVLDVRSLSDVEVYLNRHAPRGS